MEFKLMPTYDLYRNVLVMSDQTQSTDSRFTSISAFISTDMQIGIRGRAVPI